MIIKSFLTTSIIYTEKLGFKIGFILKTPCVFILSGNMGVGKTCFIRGLIKGILNTNKIHIFSPTFNIINKYNTKPCIYHLDLYKLNILNKHNFVSVIENIFTDKKIFCIEWGNKIKKIINTKIILININFSIKKIGINPYYRRIDLFLSKNYFNNTEIKNICKI